jgi:pimeloyl-ACP methyl ester carboxylesterase
MSESVACSRIASTTSQLTGYSVPTLYQQGERRRRGDFVDRDAVVVLPGLMGSELVDARSGRVLWGVADAGWYVRAWTSGHGLDNLAVTDDELEGRTTRLTATRALRFAAFAPMLRGAEPYTALLRGAAAAVMHRDAVLEFAYDWRLPIAMSAAKLSEKAQSHLSQWRTHPQGSVDAKLLLVAHSMGGLVAQYFADVLGGHELIRAIVALGTPFYGSVKAVQVLSSGQGAPLPFPRQRLRSLAVRLPGLYDLLPTYRCVEDGTGMRRLSTGDVVALGGDPYFAEQARATHEALSRQLRTQVRPLVGVGQRTAQSLILSEGIASVQEVVLGVDGHGRVDRRGDGTVYRESATLPGTTAAYLPQTHAALARTDEAVSFVQAVLTENERGPALGGSPLGIWIPDVVPVGRPFAITVDGAEDPAQVSCRVTDVGANVQVSRPMPKRSRDGLTMTTIINRPGIYRIEVKSGGSSAVSELLLAIPGDFSATADG